MTKTQIRIPCTCRGYNPADPCGHGDTAEGCPKHDRTLPQYFCLECRGQMMPCEPDGDEYACLVCGETIQCDECGQPWTDDHACDHACDGDSPPANWFYAKEIRSDLTNGAQ